MSEIVEMLQRQPSYQDLLQLRNLEKKFCVLIIFILGM